MRFFNFLLLSSFFLLTACQDTPPNLLSRFPDVETGTVENEEFEIDSVRNPYLMACVEGSIFFANLNLPLMLSQFDATSGKFMGDFLSRGEGPEELLFISGLSTYKDRLAVIDSDKKEMLLYQMTKDGMARRDSQITLQNDSAILISLFNCIPLTEEYTVATGLVRGNRLALLNNHTGKAIKGFGNYPGNKKDADIENGFAYQGFMSYQPTKKVLAIGSGFGESISFYDMSHPTSPTLIKEYIHAYPAYKDISNQQSQGVVFKKENIMGFIAMTASPDYCIGLFSGKEHSSQHGGDKLLLFDWNGNAQKAIQLDQPYDQLTYNEQARKVLLFGTEQSGNYRLASIRIE